MLGGAMTAAFVGFGTVGTAQAQPAIPCPIICDLPGGLIGDGLSPQALSLDPGSAVAIFDPILDNPLTLAFTFGMIGNGADGNPLHPNGFNGGFLFGSGGDGYSPTALDGGLIQAGNGGNAGFFGGNGGNGGRGADSLLGLTPAQNGGKGGNGGFFGGGGNGDTGGSASSSGGGEASGGSGGNGGNGGVLSNGGNGANGGNANSTGTTAGGPGGNGGSGGFGGSNGSDGNDGNTP